MEILDSNAGLISNYEVFHHLQRITQVLPATTLQGLHGTLEKLLVESERLDPRERRLIENKNKDAQKAQKIKHEAQFIESHVKRAMATRQHAAYQTLGPTVWIHENTLSYLSKQSILSNHYTEEQLQIFMVTLIQFCGQRQFTLTLGEQLALINIRPKTLVELHVIIEECEERLKPEDIDALLELIAKHLPLEPEHAEMEE